MVYIPYEVSSSANQKDRKSDAYDQRLEGSQIILDFYSDKIDY